MDKIESNDKPFTLDDDDELEEKDTVTVPVDDDDLIETELATIVYELFRDGKLHSEIKNPAAEFTNKTKNHDFDNLTDDEFQAALEQTKALSELWENQKTEKLGILIEKAILKFDRPTAETAISLLLARVPKSRKTFAFDKSIFKMIGQ